MQEPPSLPNKISSDRLFWMGLFASPVLSCLLFSTGDVLGNGSSSAPAFILGSLLVLTTLAGAFYCGFKLGWRCTPVTAGRVILGLIFTAGFLVLDFVVFFIGCCVALDFH